MPRFGFLAFTVKGVELKVYAFLGRMNSATEVPSSITVAAGPDQAGGLARVPSKTGIFCVKAPCPAKPLGTGPLLPL